MMHKISASVIALALIASSAGVFADEPVLISAPETPELISSNISFSDVDENNEFYEDIIKSAQNGIFNGIDEEHFDPDGAVTRGMLVTVLGRTDNVKEGTKCDFSDVEEGEWYYDYVAWAKENGIVDGFEDGTFKPSQAVSRQDALKIIYSFCEYKGIGPVESWAVNIPYADLDQVAEYASSPVMWNVINEYMLPDASNNLRPRDDAKRGELAHATNVLFDQVKNAPEKENTALKEITEINDEKIVLKDSDGQEMSVPAADALAYDNDGTELKVSDLKAGDKALVLENGGKIAVIRSNEDKNAVAFDTFVKSDSLGDMIDSKGELALYIDTEKYSIEELEGKQLLVFYNIMTMSLPPITTPVKIVVAGEGQVSLKPVFESVSGEITKLDDKSLTIKAEEIESVFDLSDSAVYDNAAEEIKAADLKVGDSVTVYSKTEKNAAVIVKNSDEGNFTTADKFVLAEDGKLADSTGMLSLNVSEDDAKSLDGKELLVFYTVTTRSIPAITTPVKVIDLTAAN
ncbi:MAG: S-layer homology domain-containing protein [Clostridiales bacterium]|nr:S-layer homology domain-containing protein [Clostridiales bacterium]